jgi:hypothetical protein
MNEEKTRAIDKFLEPSPNNETIKTLCRIIRDAESRLAAMGIRYKQNLGFNIIQIESDADHSIGELKV